MSADGALIKWWCLVLCTIPNTVALSMIRFLDIMVMYFTNLTVVLPTKDLISQNLSVEHNLCGSEFDKIYCKIAFNLRNGDVTRLTGYRDKRFEIITSS